MTENTRQKELSPILESDLFSNLLPDEKKYVSDRTGTLKLKKGGVLFSDGKKAEHLFLLQEGLLRIFKPREDGGEDEIASFAPGDIIGDFDFARDAEYDAYAEAAEDSMVIMFPKPGLTMDKIAIEEPVINSKILLNSAAMVTARIKSTRKVIIESSPWVRELHRKIYEDSSTGLWKQSFITDEINGILEDPMALIMLKPDRFKILVDTLGHEAGDKAMVKIAAILKNITHVEGRGWPMRFKSNETGILMNKCNADQAKALALAVSSDVAGITPVPLGNKEVFSFSGSIAWGIWPADDRSWDSLFTNTYKLLLDTWKEGGNKIVHYEQILQPRFQPVTQQRFRQGNI